MTAHEMEQYVERHNDGTLWLKVGARTFTKLQASMDLRQRNEGDNWFYYNGIRVICADRERLRRYQDRRTLEHLGGVIGGYGWSIEE